MDVVSHGGQHRMRILVEGLPMVVVPIKDDQPVIAQQVVKALEFDSDLDASQFGNACDPRHLTEPSLS